MNTIGERIESVRKSKGLTKTEIWKGAGLSSGVYSQWMNGQNLSGENLLKVAEILDVDPQWLQTGKASKASNKNIANVNARKVLEDSNENGVEIPLLAATGSMGNGNEDHDADLVIDVLRVTKQWLNKTLTNVSTLSNLRFIHAMGDSMTPTFNDGDILLVDSGANGVSVDGVYVLDAHNRLFIKRVRRKMDGAFEISSDNPSVKTVDILNGDHEVTIKGRVVWVWNGRRV